ncbi:leiomodin-3 [Chanos chanos]|uniref:Leiomodin-3 n=1 Tax=Chanos chanos TaxID=29144 RepID=A0A6J2V3S0_CHACN|nr:leiomodin-3 [Chanos chanos]
MSDHSDQDLCTEDIDEDEILAGLSAEELQQLHSEMDVIAPDERVPVGMRQRDASYQPPVSDKSSPDPDLEDINEDEILAGLSSEEIKQLQNEMDVIAPDEGVPVGMRQRDQTEKAPTGRFDHRSLVDYLYWEKESKRMLEEERVPATLLPSERKMSEKMEKEGKAENDEEVEYVYEEVVEEVEAGEGEELIEEVIEEIIEEVVEEVDEEKEDKQCTKTDPKENNTIPLDNTEELIQPPLEFADVQSEKNQAKEIENVSTPVNSDSTPSEPAASMNPNECWVPEKEERKISKLNIPKLNLGGSLIKRTARPSGNDTNLESTLDKIRKNHPSVTEVNLNNIENIPKEMLVDYVNALKKNKHVKTFSIANTGADENIAFCLANMLRENKSITTLNIESNFITGKGIVAIMRCLQFNETLTELRFHNQRHMLGHHAEMEVSRLLKANNTLLKMGYHFELPGPRMVVTNLLTRNLDRQRQQRMEEQRLQQIKEQKEIMEMYESSLNLPPGLLEMLGGYLPAMALLSQGPPEILQNSEDPSSEPNPSFQLRKTPNHPTPQMANPDSSNPLKEVHLRKTPRKRDPFLDLNSREDRHEGKVNIQLRSTPKQRSAGNEGVADERARLKNVIKTLKPVPRQRQPPKVELTPRDKLLSEIRQSNVAYLKAVPLPKVLESSETSLF